MRSVPRGANAAFRSGRKPDGKELDKARMKGAGGPRKHKEKRGALF